MADARRLIELGMTPELASELVAQITAVSAAIPTDADIADAIASKTEIAALTGSSTAANIVTALQA
ncbi:hypothetical protein [Sphingopyxis terrae]|uniref:hypothetical protein n=1 Tax=Sphingopyxis terrae TaxID=33052 RepID=UPI000788801A|nr:hypothetical protein [Sphingopyxis terrae]